MGRGIPPRPPTRATESFNGGHAPSSTGHSNGTTIPQPPPPPLQTFSSPNTTHGPGPHGSGSSQSHATPKRVTIAPHALIDPPGKSGSLVRAVPARVVSSEQGPHRTYGYLPARDPLQNRECGIYQGNHQDRGYHTLNSRISGGVGGNPHQVYPIDRNQSKLGDGHHHHVPHGRLVHQSSDTTHGGAVVNHHTLPHPPHRASSLPHQPLSSVSQNSAHVNLSDNQNDSQSTIQNDYALKLQDAGEISKDVVV